MAVPSLLEKGAHDILCCVLRCWLWLLRRGVVGGIRQRFLRDTVEDFLCVCKARGKRRVGVGVDDFHCVGAGVGVDVFVLDGLRSGGGARCDVGGVSAVSLNRHRTELE